MANSVLVIGGGGREHAIAWKLAQSDVVGQVFVCPGNAGTAFSAKVRNVSIDLHNHLTIAKWCRDYDIKLVVVGPEDPLANGLADDLKNEGIMCFGPSKSAAFIEASKEFSKSFMERHGIPTSRWKAFTDVESAKQHIISAPYRALVIKASGLAAGKGVVVAQSKEEACDVVASILKDKIFGSAGDVVIIEELLVGEEISVLCFTDGENLSVMPVAQDHKRLLEGDKGPNTGGMGAYCPCSLVNVKDLETIKTKILQEAINGLKKEGRTFVGVLFAGVMLTKDGPKALEYNCRFGDPETQAILPLLESDLYSIMWSCMVGDLRKTVVRWKENTFSVGVVLASKGYPGSYSKEMAITGMSEVLDRPRHVLFHSGTALKDEDVVTNGGRVLLVAALGNDFITTVRQAQLAAETIKFEGKQYRRDIGHRQAARMSRISLTYQDSGVDITAGNSLVEAIKPMAAKTCRRGVIGGIGGFGGLFDLSLAGYKDPILVSGTDGVGTKLKNKKGFLIRNGGFGTSPNEKTHRVAYLLFYSVLSRISDYHPDVQRIFLIAEACGIHNTIGIDLVAMCVNDVLANGAEPLFFLDYFACGKINVDTASQIIEGVTEGCLLAGCALIGGECAEMPAIYAPHVYDLAGFTVGALEREKQLPRVNDIINGDVVIGIASSGLHSNGFSLVRKVVERSGLDYGVPAPFNLNKSLGEELLTQTKIYSKTLLPIIQSGLVKAYAHITGGGLIENIPRVLPSNVGVHLDATCWPCHPVFGWLAATGNISNPEMLRTFNCGLGAVLIVGASDAQQVIASVHAMDELAYDVGTIIPFKDGDPRVQIINFQVALQKCTSSFNLAVPSFQPVTQSLKRRVAVLISGSGTNLQAMMNSTRDPINQSTAEIVLVISNIPTAKGLERAERAGIETKVVNHKDYNSRLDFDMTINKILKEFEIEIVCLAGFMRILTGDFVKLWNGRMLNIHPSLLPSFKGTRAHKQALDAGVRISGCTVHFVTEEVDAGAILVQEVVPIEIGDTEGALEQRIHQAEYRAYPKALELVSSGKVALGPDGKLLWRI